MLTLAEKSSKFLSLGEIVFHNFVDLDIKYEDGCVLINLIDLNAE